MTEQEILDTINSKLAQPTGYTFKTVLIACIVAFLVGAIIGSYITKSFFPNMSMPIVVTKEILSDPIKLTQIIKEPYAVTTEIIREISTTKPSANAIDDADKTLVVPPTQTTTDVKGNPVNVTEQYNIVLDRKKELGIFTTTESAGLMAGYAPNKNTMYHVYVGKKFNSSGTDVGGGVSVRF